MSAFLLPAQPVDATRTLNLSEIATSIGIDAARARFFLVMALFSFAVSSSREVRIGT
jgi:hypothetical protein